MISLLFKLLLKPWGLVVLGVALAGFAWLSVDLSGEALPERAALKQAVGVLDRVTKVSKGRTHRVTYDFEITSANGYVVTLTLPERDITEGRVKSLRGRPVVALFSDTVRDNQEVWELSTAGTVVVSYAKVRQRRVELQEFEAASAPYIGGAGLVAAAAGIVALLRRRGRAAATA